MRLWHQLLIEYLPNKQLLGEHREVCALRGLGFGKKHRIVNYVFSHPYANLYHYHLLVMKEMHRRGYKVDSKWFNINYRGKRIGYDYSTFTKYYKKKKLIYVEHDYDYLIECLNNLYKKGIVLSINNQELYNLLKNKNVLFLINYIE